MALPHHNTAHSDERRRSEAPLLRTKHASDCNVTTSTDLTVGLHRNTPTKVVQHESLVRLSETKLPRQTRALDTRPARRTRTTIVARDENVVRLRLRHARGDNSNSRLGDELDRDPGPRASALQVVDKLLQVFDRVDMVMRRGRD